MGWDGDLRGGGLRFLLAFALLEAIAVAVHLQDVDMVGESVQQCAGEPFRAGDLGPLLKRKVGCDQRGVAFIALAEDLEEQLGSGLRQRHETQFIDDQQFVASQLLLQTHQMLLVSGLDQFTDQGRGGGEAHAMAMQTGGQAEGQRDVRFAGATVAQDQRIFPAGEKLRSRQLQPHGFVQGRDGEEVEAIQTLDDWELRLPDAPFGGAAVAVQQLQFRELQQVARIIEAFGGAR